MKKISVAILLCSALFALIACGGGGGGNSENSRELLRVVHAAPTLGTITVTQDGSPFVTGLTYGQASAYVDIVESAGAPSVFGVRVEPEFTVPSVTAEETITFPYIKTLLITETSGVPEVTFLDDTATQLPDGQGRVRFVNANVAAGAIDIYFTDPSIPITGRTPEVTALAVKGVSSSFTVVPDDYRVRMTKTAVTSLIFDSKIFPVADGLDLTFYLLEKKGGGTRYTSLVVDADDR